MRLTISIELDQLGEIDKLGPVFDELKRLQEQGPVNIGMDVTPGLTDPEDGVEPDPEPEPEPPPTPRKRAKRKTPTAKRTRKAKGARKVVTEKPLVELPPNEELQRPEQPEHVEVADEASPVMVDPKPNIPAQVKPEDAVIEEDEKIVRLREQPPPEDINPNVVFSQLVQKSQSSAITLLNKYGLTRFSQAEGETLVSMIQDAQLLLTQAG